MVAVVNVVVVVIAVVVVVLQNPELMLSQVLGPGNVRETGSNFPFRRAWNTGPPSGPKAPFEWSGAMPGNSESSMAGILSLLVSMRDPMSRRSSHRSPPVHKERSPAGRRCSRRPWCHVDLGGQDVHPFAGVCCSQRVQHRSCLCRGGREGRRGGLTKFRNRKSGTRSRGSQTAPPLLSSIRSSCRQARARDLMALVCPPHPCPKAVRAHLVVQVWPPMPWRPTAAGVLRRALC